MKEFLLVVLAMVAVAACGSSEVQAPGESVPLVTAREPDELGGEDGIGGCYLFSNVGILVPESTHGTAAQGEFDPGDQPGVHPLIWPPGYTARRSGGEIEVLDASGTVVAVTGRRYVFWTSAWGGGSSPQYTGNPGCVEPT